LLYISPTYEEVFGRTCESVYAQPRSWIESVHPDDRQLVLADLEQPERGISTDTEFRVMRPDDSIRWVRCRAFPIKNQAGGVYRVAGLAEDITERKQAEEALRKVHERLELAVRSSNVALWERDMTDGLDGQIEWLNFREQWGTGKPEDYPTADSAMTLVHPDDRDRLTRLMEAYLCDEIKEFKSTHRVQHRDGSYHWALNQGVLFRDAQGKPIRWSGSIIDITHLKRAEEALRASEQRFRTFVDHATDAFFLLDDGGVILDVNNKACQSLGYTRDELVGMMTPTDFDPDFTPADKEENERKLNAGETIAFESRHRRKDGNVFPVEVRCQAFWEGGRRFTVALARDVTERKRAEDALRESEERFRTLADNIAQFAWMADETGWVFWYNRRWLDYTGTTLEEMQGWAWRTVLHPDHVGRVVAKIRRYFETGAVWEDTFPIRGKNGGYRWFLSRAIPIRDESGKVLRWFGTNTDVTAQREAKESAEAANRAKDEFLANVSHEIRTPMNAILGMTELALDTPLTEDQQQCLKTVKSAADSLLGIINDLLDFSKIEAGKLELDPADFSLRSALGDTLRALAMRAHKKRLELISNVQPDVPDALIGDAGRLRQVLLNLVGNALKFTEEGEVVVRVGIDKETGLDKETRRQGDKEKEEPNGSVSLSPCLPVSLSFEVRDTGIGIPPDKQERIFRAFEQEDTSTTRKYGGTGLGLTIASRLVALMGGKITVESDPGRGSSFAFTARFDRQPHSPQPLAARPPVLLYNLPVLIVDDNATNRHILEEWLRGWQMEPAAVGDGLAAMDALWHRAANGRSYALVLLDARMPDADGLTLAATIRERAELSATRIILLTSGDRPGDLARFRELRIDAHLLKPVQQDELLETIYQVMSKLCTSWWLKTTSLARDS
jgi:PAS domain S-box-containing protein